MNWLEIILELLLMPLVAFFVGLVLVLMMRRIAARLQRRVGPPWFQPMIDIIKLFAKKTQTSHGVMHEMGIVVAIGAYIAAETLLPVPGMEGIAAKGGIITLSYFLMIPSLGMALGVGQCANPNGSIGISRALTSMLAYDIPFILVVFGVAYHFGNTNLVQIIAVQQTEGIAGWGIVQMPLLAAVGLIAMQGMMAKHPFETYVAPAEIATGPMVEMSGKFMGGLFVMQSFAYYTVGVLYTSLFLGGGENWFTFLIKVALVIMVPMTIGMIFPRYRIDDMLRFFWKWPTAIALIGLVAVLY